MKRLTLLLVCATVSLTACQQVPTDPDSLAPAALEDHAPAYLSPEAAALEQQLKAVRRATKKYRDIEQARADGYVAVSPYVPGMGFHFADGPPFGTDLEDPGVLVYYTNASYNPAPGDAHDPAHDDDLILGGVEWLVQGDQTANPPDIFMDEVDPRNLRVSEAEGWHYEAREGFSGLHAWIYRGNPEGLFHTTNPTID